MSVTAKVLIPSKTVEVARTTQYTAANVTTIIDKFTAVNYSAGAQTLSVNLVTKATSASNDNIIVQNVSLSAGETYMFPEIVGHVLAVGGFISTLASAADSISIRASGREIS